MSEPRRDDITPHGDSPGDVLRAKYLDYCSAKVADTLLQLTPDEIFLLARDAARESGAEGELSYDRAVRLATATLFQRLDLPSFEAWLDDYQANPERYDAYLMGLWRSGIGDEPDH